MKPDVVIGGGHPDWESGYISRSNYNALKGSDEWVFVERVGGVDGGQTLLDASMTAVNSGSRLFGLFGGSKNCFDPYEPVDSPGNP